MELTAKKWRLLAGMSALAGIAVVLIVGTKRIMNAMKVSKNGLNLIKEFEGLRTTAYQDSVGVWTIGYGHTSGVKKGQTITAAQADDFLRKDIEKVEKQIALLGLNLNQNQLDAVASFVFNLGYGKLLSSTLLKKMRVNVNDKTIADEFKRWVYAGGIKLQGLAKRRAAEAKLYFS